jgi:phosphatidyl-myo-inositol dimannoside synthase
VYRKATKIIVVSDFVKSQIEKEGFKLPPSVIIPVGVDVDRFSLRGGSSSFVPTASPYILSVGALKERKGFHITIEAFSKIAQSFPLLHLVIIGTDYHDGYKEQLAHLAKKLGVLDRVHFLSNLSDEELQATYAHAKLFVLCPITTADAIEGFGMVYLEANAAGLPVVGTRQTGAEAAIQDGENGLLAEGNPEDVSEKIRIILENPELRERMSCAGRAHVQRFTWLKIAQLIIDMYHKIL